MEKTRKYYQELISVKKDYMAMLKNFLVAFATGGGVAILGQLFFDLYYQIFHFAKDDASLFMTLTMVLLAGILTAFGIYDNLGQIAKCGLAIPITGEGQRSVTHNTQIYLYICNNAKKDLKFNKKWEKIKQNREIIKRRVVIPYEVLL